MLFVCSVRVLFGFCFGFLILCKAVTLALTLIKMKEQSLIHSCFHFFPLPLFPVTTE